jgi:tellurium resistance protein TerD
MSKFNLEKGDKFSLEKALSKIRVGLGWDVSKVGAAIDIDAHAFGCVNQNGTPKFYNDASHAVTYANKSNLKREGAKFGTHDGSLCHCGDNLTGAGEGADEVINVDLDLLPKEINEVSFFVTIHEAKTRKQHFGLVENTFIEIVDASSGKELCKYALNKEFDGNITVQIGSMMKDASGNWSFQAVGAGTADKGLGDVLAQLS